jgi:Leucine-rich repeat (LRR) protein
MRIETPSLKRLIQNLTHLNELFLDRVDMSSVSPASLKNLSSSLTSLSLWYCGLKGRFPDNIFHLPNLQLLNVGFNDNLTGSLPSYDWSSPLKSLDLSGTKFPIDLPTLISNLNSLKELYLRRCNFIGSYPTLLPNLTHITSLDLGSNSFVGQIPWSHLNFERLTFLDLSYNNFTGQIPDLSSSKSFNIQLEYLILTSNLLNGTIPSWVYAIPSLRWLYLSDNQFTGYIGEFQHNALEVLDLSDNKLHGPLPMSISKLVRLRRLDISF